MKGGGENKEGKGERERMKGKREGSPQLFIT